MIFKTDDVAVACADRKREVSEDGDNGDEGLSAGDLVGWDDFDGVLAGLGVSGAAHSSLGVVDVSVVAEEVNAAADHADEEVLAVGV